MLRRLSVEPEYTLYTCCPKCFALYPPKEASAKSAGDSRPRTCTQKLAPDQSECGASLYALDSGEGKDQPIKTFALQSMRAWLAQLLLRPGIEQILEESWSSRASAGGKCLDILDSETLRAFLGPDHMTPFSVQNHGSLHLTFSINIDWFNPFGNKQAGKSHSIGAIYLACLNLPPQLRYKPENIFLAGIIPGPREPNVDQLNYLLAPLVDELLVLWSTGVFMNRTLTRPLGRLVRAAVIPLVCDLPAARKAAGYASHSAKAHFCSFCSLSKDSINQIHNRSLWGYRSYAEHLRLASAARNAAALKTRLEIFQNHGIRWSELLRLPYWDPTRFTMVDAMHNLYLGEFQHHCRDVLGINVNSEKGSSIPLHTPEQQLAFLRTAVSAIQRKSESALLTCRKGYLLALAQINDVPLPGATFVKRDIAEALVAWVRRVCMSLSLARSLI